MNIVLCGLPRCGKTTHGKLLAKQLGFTFVDTDQMIGASYQEIFLEKGEACFRALEKEQIEKLLSAKNCVIALGGGAVCHHVELIRKLGCLFYLKVDPEVVWKRMEETGLPAFLKTREDFDIMVKERVPIYERESQFTLLGGKDGQ